MEPRHWLVFLFNCVLIKTVTPQCTVAQVCVTDVTVADCAPGQILAPNASIFGCCPGCQTASGIITEGCQAPASCLPDGSYGPVQCKGDMFTGRCFCSDERGNRIFGQMWRNEATEMTCGENQLCTLKISVHRTDPYYQRAMNCSNASQHSSRRCTDRQEIKGNMTCSRRRAQLESSGRRVVSLHCTPTGDYEPLQCDEGMCWCADSKTGQPIVSPVLRDDMTRLPCYSAAVMGEQYLRRCESIVQSMAVIHQEQSEHGTNFLGNPTTFCDYDGSYGPYQIRNGIAYCTGRDAEILGSWQIMASEMAGMNCNCARDTMLHFPERGMTVTEICLANGNYQPNQNVGDVYYCVDTDGYPIELLDQWPADRCASHA